MLTAKQRQEMHHAMASYLASQGFTASLEKFCSEADVAPDDDHKYGGLLEKKWSSVMRLTKRIMDLENKVSELSESAKSGGGAHERRKPELCIPRGPELHCLSGHREPVLRVVFHPKFNLIASASEDASVKLWDYESGEFEKTLKGHTGPVNDIAFDSSGESLVSCSSDMSIKIWDVQHHQCIRTLHGHDHTVSAVAFTPTGDHVVSASRDKTVKLWETVTGYCMKTLHGHSDWVRRLAISRNGHFVASCSIDKTIRIWSLESKDCKAELNGHDHVVECVSWAPDTAKSSILKAAGYDPKSSAMPGPFLVTGSRDKTLKVWDANSGSVLFSLVGHDNWVREAVFHPYGKYILSVSDDKTLRVWDIEHKRCHKALEAHDHFCTSVAILPSATLVVTGSVDQTIRVWECR